MATRAEYYVVMLQHVTPDGKGRTSGATESEAPDSYATQNDAMSGQRPIQRGIARSFIVWSRRIVGAAFQVVGV